MVERPRQRVTAAWGRRCVVAVALAVLAALLGGPRSEALEPGYGTPRYTDGFVSFQFGQGDKAIDLRFLRAFDDAGDGRFVRTPDT